MYKYLLFAIHVFLTYSIDPPLSTYTKSSNHPTDTLICGESNPDDCYLSTFSASSQYQVVREGQSIPAGLHVRIDIESGRKEAKSNNPNEDQQAKAGHETVLWSEHHDQLADSEQRSQLETRIDRNKFEADYASNEVHEQGLLGSPCSSWSLHNEERLRYSALSSCLSQPPNNVTQYQLLLMLEHMTELVHDLEWGLALARNQMLSIRLLFNLDPDQTSLHMATQSGSTLLLATALQNNNEAFPAFSDSLAHAGVQAPSVVLKALRALEDRFEGKKSMAGTWNLAARLVFFLAQLCQEPSQTWLFVKGGGLQLLATLVTRAGREAAKDAREACARALKRICHLIIDVLPSLWNLEARHEYWKEYAALSIALHDYQYLSSIKAPSRSFDREDLKQAMASLDGLIAATEGRKTLT